METLLPDGWARPSGYSNGVKAKGETIFVAGQIAWDQNKVFHSDDLGDQVRRSLGNVMAVLSVGGAAPEHVVRMTWYVTSMTEYRANLGAVGEAYRSVMGSNYPAMTLVEVAGLVEPKAKVEIEASAVLPD